MFRSSNTVLALWLLCTLIPCSRAFSQAPVYSDQACAAAALLKLPGARITQALAIHPQPGYVVPGTGNVPDGLGGAVSVLRPFCRVAGVVQPAIRFEVWLPLEGWNGRFQGLGLGALSGAVPYAQMAAALSQGYAAGGTDTGHRSGFMDAGWTQNATGLDREIVADWAYRGIHEMTLKSQAIVAAVYGVRAKYRYFVGCSSGGHQALTEAQRYPEDYDGILAGAPANYWTHLMAAQLAYGLATRTDPATDLESPVDKLGLIHDEVLRQCDALDGVRDGVIENPASCHVDLEALACSGADTRACLTRPQMAALRAVYSPVRGDDGKTLFPALAPGSELGWKLMSSVQVSFAQTFYRYFVFQNPEWDYRSLQLPRDVVLADQKIGTTVNSVDSDLRAFRAHGGKLLQYHGWNDPLISPYSSIAYHQSVIAGKAGRDVRSFHRLFMVPGMGHCRGGEGADAFDGLGALERWVELHAAPDSLIAARVTEGRTERTHLLCPYPEAARYRGTGSTDEAASYRCAAR